jgi:anti-sigma factor RsiW
MSCSPFDLKDYLFGELDGTSRGAVARHLEACSSCREELRALEATRAALGTWRDEEIPQRIAFVSDRVYEPSPLRRWGLALWNSGPRLGFVSAALLSAALVTHGVQTRLAPPPAPYAAQPAARISPAQIQADIDRRVAAAVRSAVAESEARQSARTLEILSAARREIAAQRHQDREAIARVLDMMDRQMKNVYRSAVYTEVPR